MAGRNGLDATAPAVKMESSSLLRIGEAPRRNGRLRSDLGPRSCDFRFHRVAESTDATWKSAKGLPKGDINGMA